MQLKVTPNDYAKIAVVVSAVVFLISAALAFVWYGESGFSGNTVIAVACAVVSAVFLGISSWTLAKFTRAERLENVDVNLKFVPGEKDFKEESDDPGTDFKLPGKP